MKKLPLLAVLILSLILFAAGCGGDEPSTTTEPSVTSTTVGGLTTPMDLSEPGLFVQLTGDQVEPPVQTEASGTLNIRVDTSGITYQLAAENLERDDVTSAGIYFLGGGSGGEDELIVDLLPGEEPNGSSASSTGEAATTSTTSATSTETTDSGVSDLLKGNIISRGFITEDNLRGRLAGSVGMEFATVLLSEERKLYVHINTTQYPDGELRGIIDLNMSNLGKPGATSTTDTNGS